jgi:hypothetical protein
MPNSPVATPRIRGDDGADVGETSWLSLISNVPSSIRVTRAMARTKMGIEDKSVQIDRAIRTGKLNTLRRLHTRPINVVVYHGSV